MLPSAFISELQDEHKTYKGMSNVQKKKSEHSLVNQSWTGLFGCMHGRMCTHVTEDRRISFLQSSGKIATR